MDSGKFWWSNQAAGPVGIGNSLRFRGAQYLEFKPAANGNRQQWSWSGWLKRTNVDGYSTFFGKGSTTPNRRHFTQFTPANDLVGQLYLNIGGQTEDQNYLWQGRSDAIYRDPSAWMHFLWVWDTPNATQEFRSRWYVNGTEIDSSGTNNLTQNEGSGMINTSGQGFCLGARFFDDNRIDRHFEGYMADVHFVDGQVLDPTAFGRENANGVWVPQDYTGTYGTNGFHLDFADPADIGADRSGNGNHFTPNGFDTSTPGVATYDIFTDSPTNNDPQPFNPLFVGQTWQTYERANRLVKTDGSTNIKGTGIPLSISKLPQSGRHLFSITTGENTWNPSTAPNGSRLLLGICISNLDDLSSRSANNVPEGYYLVRRWQQGNNTINAGASTANATSTPPGPTGWQSGERNADIVCAWDGDTRNIWFGQVSRHRTNPSYTGVITWYDSSAAVDASADPDTGTNPFATLPEDFNNIFIWIASANMSSLVPRAETDSGVTASYTNAPTSFNEINCNTLPAAPIPDGSDHFQAITDTGANILTAAQTAFPNGLWWIKKRDGNNNHQFVDSVRGGDLAIRSPDNSAEGSYSDPGGDSVAWCWKAGGAGAANTDGTITTQVSANATAGFSIMTYTGNGTAGATIGHGLSEAPEFFMIKGRNLTNYNQVYHASMGPTYHIVLNTSDKRVNNSNRWNNTAPTDSVITLGNADAVNRSAAYTYVCYAWHSVPGYSAFGGYDGNGNNDGTFVYTGFRPAFLMVKLWTGSSNAGGWSIIDSTRDPVNASNHELRANETSGEVTNTFQVDLLANGFKLRGTSRNGAGNSYIYFAFAENPFGGSNVVPATAR